MNKALRTPEGNKKYQDYINDKNRPQTCALCDKEAIKKFNFWKISDNSFPYDRIASIHHILIPIRHIIEDEMTKEELDELKEIKKTYVNDNYDWLIEATNKAKSIPNHFHLHLVVGKDFN